MKRGRPTNPESKKGRTHAALITVKAELILRAIKKKRENFNFSQYVTAHIIKDFGHNTADINALRTELNTLNTEMTNREERVQIIVTRIQELKIKQSELEANQILGDR